MASHHHLCHHSAVTPAACNCHCCYASYTPCHHLHHSVPPPSPPTLHQPHFYPDLINPPNPPHFSELHQDRSFQDRRPTHAAVSSLLRRISALESALRRRSPRSSASHSLRDAAARTIQTHFRAFLCRRSRTLRQLKDLTAIKSTLGTLKSLISKNPQSNYDVVYRKTLNLLLKLDTIQGDDPLIRNGKTSLTTELDKFLDLLGAICVEEKSQLRDGHDLKSRVSNVEAKLGNLKIRDSKGVNVEKLRALVERIEKLAEEIDEEEGQEIQNPNIITSIRKHGDSGNKIGDLARQENRVGSKVKKNVSFVENGKVYRVTRRPHEEFLEEYCNKTINGNNVGEEVDNDDDNEDYGEEIPLEDEDSLLGLSHVEKGSGSYTTSNNDGIDEFLFRPPMPVKMERKR